MDCVAPGVQTPASTHVASPHVPSALHVRSLTPHGPPQVPSMLVSPGEHTPLPPVPAGEPLDPALPPDPATPPVPPTPPDPASPDCPPSPDAPPALASLVPPTPPAPPYPPVGVLPPSLVNTASSAASRSLAPSTLASDRLDTPNRSGSTLPTQPCSVEKTATTTAPRKPAPPWITPCDWNSSFTMVRLSQRIAPRARASDPRTNQQDRVVPNPA